ncbi:imidazole glycerol phosphate synthase subunit HisH [Arachnia propionica]|uniref:Imidazole glycerol phosphate synthase subunit HisH n=1 Tax=Arachnia propionica TaxID=1750 RepID=A0A3P1WS08_9ACTN|nr:imidazole glycerol phosphate synthase subunit HisH [Arachnia propionica]RRD49041.1 imidazole glycerol phosphate synthase subunit HisH [Arachnia propionica]
MTSTTEIGVVDYGVGNLGSVVNMLRYLGLAPVMVTSAEQADRVDHLILPGVGAYDAGVTGLRDAGLADAVLAHCAKGKPLLGICLGMQLLLEGSAEGELPGLGLIPGRCEAFADHVVDRRIPHMGWQEVFPTGRASAVRLELPSPARFYFAHSYFLPIGGGECTYAEAEFGIRFSAVVGQGSVIGMQFHPEKSHRFGMAALTAFVGWRP